MGYRGWWRFISVSLPAGVVLLILVLGFCNCVQEKAPYYSFFREATKAPPIVFYDYIIIGGGTTSCPLAASLSQNASVLVLERGGSPYGNPDITSIASFASALSNTSPGSASQLFISTDGVFNVRARVLGGGSALNAGFYTRASAKYVEEAGWNKGLVEESYQWVEHKVVFEPQIRQWQSAVRDGLLEAGVDPFNGFTYDHVIGTKVGGTIFDQEGRRHSSADLLDYADPRWITVYLHATVWKIIFIKKGGRRVKAHCVIFRDAKGVKHKACLSRDLRSEIILAAGAIGSPQILMLSGIGPARHLRAHGINVVQEQPFVGQGMADNPMNGIFVPSPKPVEISLIQVVGITKFDTYIEAASGSSFAYSWARRLARGHGLLPFNQSDLQSVRTPSVVSPEVMAGALETLTNLVNETLRGGIIIQKIMGPVSRGHLELRNKNPDDNPSVTFNYFKEAEDLRKCVQGVSTIIDVINSRAFSEFRYPALSVQALLNIMLDLPVNLRPRHRRLNPAVSLEQFCMDTVMTIWHYHGGCQVGKVVDRDYRVFGVDSLRVIDASTFHLTPGTNPQATLMMLGRYMGKKILQERFTRRWN